MRDLGLLRTERVGSAVVCSWDAASPAAKDLRPLLLRLRQAGDPSEDSVYWNLKCWGAPLAKAVPKREEMTLEETLGYGLKLARQHPEVARVWPVVFAKHRSQVDLEALQRLAVRLGQKRSLGFFLDLTRTLLGNPRVKPSGKVARDRRYRKTQDFFLGPSSKRAQDLADLRSPREARNWHLRMNMPLESFKSSFDKFFAGEP